MTSDRPLPSYLYKAQSGSHLCRQAVPILKEPASGPRVVVVRQAAQPHDPAARLPMKVLKCPPRLVMTILGLAFQKRKSSVRRNRQDVPEVPVMLGAPQPSLKNHLDANENLAENLSSKSFRQCLKLRMPLNLSTASHEANGRRVVWSVRLLTSSRRRGCDILVPTN